jgi:hypothetical protein
MQEIQPAVAEALASAVADCICDGVPPGDPPTTAPDSTAAAPDGGGGGGARENGADNADQGQPPGSTVTADASAIATANVPLIINIGTPSDPQLVSTIPDCQF